MTAHGEILPSPTIAVNGTDALMSGRSGDNVEQGYLRAILLHNDRLLLTSRRDQISVERASRIGLALSSSA